MRASAWTPPFRIIQDASVFSDLTHPLTPTSRQDEEVVIQEKYGRPIDAVDALPTNAFLIVGKHVTDAPTDKQQLNPILTSIPAAIVIPENVPVDTGCCSEKAVGKALCKLRKQTVEPVFVNIKEEMGFRRFSMRKREKTQTE